ncbi:class I SAM-dependent DNA methyltransferase [Micromonospora sp. NPDC049903]|uniref:class I SAM-dependent DNA methyltransferase n=1 Tax=Micromonospora sp. NPDC049903 TaxID=3364276 RepID=UPI0037AB845A
MGPHTAAAGRATAATGDIARLANVGRAAVSNWRRRFADFPAPVGGSSASPQYALAEVQAWFARHGRPFVLRPVDTVWQSLRGATGDLLIGDRIGYLGAVLALLDRDPKRWQRLAEQPDADLITELPAALRDALPEIDHLITDEPNGDEVVIARLTVEAAEQDGHLPVFDFLCQRYREVHSRRQSVTPPDHARLMVELADVAGARVLDPACGIGELLTAASRAGAVEVSGQELSVTDARLAAVRLLLAGVSARVVAGDSLRRAAYPPGRPDVVLCDPPFGERSSGHDDVVDESRWEYGLPPRGEPELAWVQHCLAQVRPGGRVAILMPPGSASRRAGRRVRANLLRAGALRAVVSLPASTLTAAAPNLWLLQRPHRERPPAHLLVVDASTDSSRATQAWAAFDAKPAGGLPAGSRAVPIIDLLDDEVDLSPGRHLVASSPPTDYPPAVERLRSAVANLLPLLPDLTVDGAADDIVTVTIAELLRTGALLIRQAPQRLTTDGEGGHPVLTARDVRLAQPASGRADRLDDAVTIEVGDVVTPLAPRRPAVRVVSEPGALLGPRLYLLRVDADRLDPWFLAGFLRIAQRAVTSDGVSPALRWDIRRTRVPRLSLTEQRAHGEAFQRLTAFEAGLRELRALGEDLVEQGLRGLAGGDLRPALHHD